RFRIACDPLASRECSLSASGAERRGIVVAILVASSALAAESCQVHGRTGPLLRSPRLLLHLSRSDTNPACVAYCRHPGGRCRWILHRPVLVPVLMARMWNGWRATGKNGDA